jgi:hypothetical protein
MDAEIIKTQVGCGYCHFEKKCPIRSRTENKAKAGCAAFVHYTQDIEPFKSEFEKLKP